MRWHSISSGKAAISCITGSRTAATGRSASFLSKRRSRISASWAAQPILSSGTSNYFRRCSYTLTCCRHSKGWQAGISWPSYRTLTTTSSGPLGFIGSLIFCAAERAGGYKPDGTLFRYLIANAGVAVPEILHSGQSQFTDMVGGKPLGLTVCWINRRSIDLHPSVPPPDHIFPDIRPLLPLLGI